MLATSMPRLRSQLETVVDQFALATWDNLNCRFGLESVFELLALSCWYASYEDYDVSCSLPLDCFKRLNCPNFFATVVMVIIGAIGAILKHVNLLPFARHLKCRVRIQLANLFEPSFYYSTSRDGWMALAAKVTTCQRTVSCIYFSRLADLSASRI